MTYDPRRHRSVSQLNSFTRCGMLYYLERVQKVPSPPASWTIKGNTVHTALEEWEKGSRKCDDIAGLYEDSWAKALQRAEEKYPDQDTWKVTPRVKSVVTDLALRKDQGLKEVLDYVAWAKRDEDLWLPATLPDGQVAVEVPFKVDFGSDVPFFLLGYIDLLKFWPDSGAITVGDYKTGGGEV